MNNEKMEGPLGPNQRWSARRKREVVLRLLRGKALDALSRELGVEQYRLEQWREKALGRFPAGAAVTDITPPLGASLDGIIMRQGPPSTATTISMPAV